MTIEEAIEILTQHQKGTDPIYLPDLPDAEKLGIEALKRIKVYHEDDPLLDGEALPGETKD
ncbi:hypothetical protein ES708_14459 [subsurface metagenome]